MYEELEIIYENEEPYGIRDNTGYLVFFRSVRKYPYQDERYQKELKEMNELSDFIYTALKNRNKS